MFQSNVKIVMADPSHDNLYRAGYLTNGQVVENRIFWHRKGLMEEGPSWLEILDIVDSDVLVFIYQNRHILGSARIF